MLFFCFINKFELYRNISRTLLKIYLIFVLLSQQKQSRKTNILLLILKFYNSNFNNIVSALFLTFSKLDKDLQLLINSKKKFIYIFVLAFIKDTF